MSNLRHAAFAIEIIQCLKNSPIADFRNASTGYFSLIGLPGGIITRLALRIAQWNIGANLESAAPVCLLSKIKCRLLVIQSETDPFVSPEDQNAIEAALSQRNGFPTAHWRPADSQHLTSIITHREQWVAQVKALLDH